MPPHAVVSIPIVIGQHGIEGEVRSLFDFILHTHQCRGYGRFRPLNGAVAISGAKPTSETGLFVQCTKYPNVVLLPGQFRLQLRENGGSEEVGIEKELLDSVGINRNSVHENQLPFSFDSGVGGVGELVSWAGLRGAGASSISI